MIVVKLMGGHSNQMFQYAMARSLSIRYNTSLQLDLSWFDNISDNDTPRVYELGTYNINEKIFYPTFLFRLLRKIGYIRHYTEPHFHFDPTLESLGPNIYIEGYFQSWKYFMGIRNVILKDFSYKSVPQGANKKILDTIKADPNSVSLHIRRGDYVTNKDASSFHGLKDMEYYTAALNVIKKKIKKPNVYVISNDPKWCKKNLDLGVPTTIIDNNDDVTGGAEDMRLMRACRHNIMANSSFSWWGAWLNENSDKIVVAPKQWFNDPSIDTSDLIPEDWVRL